MLLLAEQEREVELIKKEVDKWEAGQKKRKLEEVTPQVEVEAPKPTPGGVKFDFKAYVDVPTMEDIEQLILKKKKEALLSKYGHATSEIQNPSFAPANSPEPEASPPPEA